MCQWCFSRQLEDNSDFEHAFVLKKYKDYKSDKEKAAKDKEIKDLTVL